MGCSLLPLTWRQVLLQSQFQMGTLRPREGKATQPEDGRAGTPVSQGPLLHLSTGEASQAASLQPSGAHPLVQEGASGQVSGAVNTGLTTACSFPKFPQGLGAASPSPRHKIKRQGRRSVTSFSQVITPVG